METKNSLQDVRTVELPRVHIYGANSYGLFYSLSGNLNPWLVDEYAMENSA
jgi:hypothetical protein